MGTKNRLRTPLTAAVLLMVLVLIGAACSGGGDIRLGGPGALR